MVVGDFVVVVDLEVIKVVGKEISVIIVFINVLDIKIVKFEKLGL